MLSKIRLSLLLLAVLVLAGPARAAERPCAGDAVGRGKKLLRFHIDDNAPANGVDDGSAVRLLPQVTALKGKGKFDVLEITSHVYKATYRMRFIYARLNGTCVLMGQEILEASNPY